jgi:hypothetical protein
MSLKILSVTLLMALSTAIVAQEKSSGDDGFRTDYQPGKVIVANKKSLDTIKKVILDRTAEFEKLYEQLSATTIELKLANIQKSNDKIIILNDFQGDVKEGNQFANHLKYIEYIFEGGKLKTVKFFYDNENYFNRIYNNYKVLEISPADVETASIAVKYIDRENKTEYKDFNGETRFKTLKLLENNLLNALQKMDVLLRRNILEKDLRIEAGLKGI